MKKVPTKNYVILGLIILLTVFLTFYVRGWYAASKEYYSRNSVIKNVVREINADEIGNYTLESQRFVLYVSSGANGEIKNFENSFLQLVKKLDNTEDILYLNLDNVSVSDFYSFLRQDFSDNDNIKSKITESDTSLYVFVDGKIVSVFNNIDNFSNKGIETFLKKWGFISD